MVDNVPHLMKNYDVLLHLSYTESYGQVIIESLLSGLGVVSTRTGVVVDLEKLIEPNVTVVTEMTPLAISSALEEAILNLAPYSIDRAIQFAHFREHEDEFVFNRIAEQLSSKIESLKVR